MIFIDWIVIIAYIAPVIGLALHITRSQRDLEDYYLAGKKIKWWQSGCSSPYFRIKQGRSNLSHQLAKYI